MDETVVEIIPCLVQSRDVSQLSD